MSTNALDLVIAVVADMSDELDCDALRNASADTRLLDGDDGIDSLSLVCIIVELERVVSDRCGRDVILADEHTIAERHSPYRTVASLAALLQDRLADDCDEARTGCESFADSTILATPLHLDSEQAPQLRN